MLKIKNINSLRILRFPKSSYIKPRYVTPQSLTQKMCICVCMCTSTHLSTRLWLILSNLNYGILCGILVGMGGGQGRLDKLQEIGHHLSDQLRLECIRMAAADQQNYSNTEDAWDAKNQQWCSVQVLN